MCGEQLRRCRSGNTLYDMQNGHGLTDIPFLTLMKEMVLPFVNLGRNKSMVTTKKVKELNASMNKVSRVKYIQKISSFLVSNLRQR